MSLTQAQLREVLHYDPTTGHFTWLKSSSKKIKPGQRAGCSTPIGYRMIRVFGRLYTEHKLAWFYMTGEWPDNTIDHIDRVRDNNAFANLRSCTHAENCRNSSVGKNSTTGIKGVHRDTRKKRKQWYSVITLDGEAHFLGFFATSREAALAYNAAAVKYHGEFAGLAEVPPEYGLTSHPCA